MQFDPNNTVIKLCARGMELEAKQPAEAKALFMQAWNEATNDFEKFTAAHYVARHQNSIEEKLHWDKTALDFALKIDDEKMKANFPSLYLNIAKCYEDIGDVKNAKENYKNAEAYIKHLPDNGYGKMTASGIKNGLERVMKR